MKVNFKLPNTRLCIVLWNSQGTLNKDLIPTPPSNDALRQRMLEKKVGYSDIRGVQAVKESDLALSMSRL